MSSLYIYPLGIRLVRLVYSHLGELDILSLYL